MSRHIFDAETIRPMFEQIADGWREANLGGLKSRHSALMQFCRGGGTKRELAILSAIAKGIENYRAFEQTRQPLTFNRRVTVIDIKEEKRDR